MLEKFDAPGVQQRQQVVIDIGLGTGRLFENDTVLPKASLRAGCFWFESKRGFPNQWRSDSTCWLCGGQQECRSLIRKTCVIA